MKGRIAYYLLVYEGPKAALDILGVPEDLRSDDPDDDDYASLQAWADPAHPEPGAQAHHVMDDVAAIRRKIQRIE
jgi:hypothetical protein